MKVALYVRCSSEKQENFDISIPAQLKALREHVNNNSFIIYKEYIEPGESAYGDDENREKFHQMIANAKEGKFEVVLVHRFNRFYRDQFKSMSYKKILKDHGVKVISITEELDSETITGFITERMIEIMDQVSSMQNSWETFKGMKENAIQGYKNGGKPPYGYIRKPIPININRPEPRYKIKWEINEEKAKVVKKIFKLRSEGKSLKSIALNLNRNLIKSATGDFWCYTSIREIILRADVYTGTYIWNRYNQKTYGTKYNEKKDWIVVENAHPAIINKKIAEKCKKTIGTSNNMKFVPVNKSRYLLTGKNLLGDNFFICKNCGGTLSGAVVTSNKKTNKGNLYYLKYICSNYRRKGTIACNKPLYVDKNWIENKIISHISNRYEKHKSIEQIAERIKEYNKNQSSEIIADLKKINKGLISLQKKINNLTQAIFEGASKEIFIPQSKILEKELNILLKRKRDLEELKLKEDFTNIQSINNIFNNFKKTLENGSNEEKSTLIKTFINQIILDPEKEVITTEIYEFPLKENCYPIMWRRHPDSNRG